MFRMTDRRLDLYDSDIGRWIKRGRKWHLVESVVDSGAITRCGRRMQRGTGYPFQLSEGVPLTRMIGQPQLCVYCHRGTAYPDYVLSDDDGSTHGESVP